MTTLQALTSYSGRMGRSQFWSKGIAPLVLAAIIPFTVLAVLYGPPLLITGWSAAFSMGLLWFQLPLWVKRAHDRNHSAWFLLISLVPVIGWLWLFIELGFIRGNADANRFGPSPLDETPAPSHPKAIPNYVSAIALAGHSLLTILLVVTAIAVVPRAVDLYERMLEGACLPGFTQLTVNTAFTFTRSNAGMHFGGLLVGLWLWMGLRLFSFADLKRPQRLLWTGVVIGACLNLFAGISLYLPTVGMPEHGPSREYPLNEWMHIKTGVGPEYLAFSYLDERSHPTARGTEAREPFDSDRARRATETPDRTIALDGWGDSLTCRVLDDAEREALGLPRTPPWHERKQR